MVFDCGRIINPLLVEEQVRGGVVMGLGQALLEACRYDDAGQFVSGTLADYLADGNRRAGYRGDLRADTLRGVECGCEGRR